MPTSVGPAPYTPPGHDQVVIRGRAVAINPLDWIIQVAGNLAYRWLKYPTVLGSDVAGEVVEGTFQHYTVVLGRMAAPIPDAMPFEDAAVLPLAVSTASCGLFQQDQLGLRYPSATAEPTGAAATAARASSRLPG